MPSGLVPAGELLAGDGKAEGSMAIYGKVFGSTLILPLPTNIWTFPIEVLAPKEVVDPSTMIPSAAAFAIPCLFNQVKGLVAVAEGIWIGLPPTLYLLSSAQCVSR